MIWHHYLRDEQCRRFIEMTGKRKMAKTLFNEVFPDNDFVLEIWIVSCNTKTRMKSDSAFNLKAKQASKKFKLFG